MEEGEEGLLDHLSDIEEASAELTATLSWINDETVRVTEKINNHATHINQLKARGVPAKVGDFKKILLLTASDMNAFSKRVEGVFPDFERSVRRLDEGVTGYISLASPSSSEDVEQVSSIRKSLSYLLSNLHPAKDSVTGFRDSALGLANMSLSKDLTRAANRQAAAINGVVRNMEEVESFALRVNFLIGEKFGDLPDDEGKQEGREEKL